MKLYGTVIAKTNSPYNKMYRQTAKITLTFELSDGGAILHIFICITYQGKQNDSVLLTNE